MKVKHAAAYLVLGVALVGDALADSSDRLSADARARLERGEQVVQQQRVEGSSWPAVTVYELVHASPEEATAVFTDYAAEAGYLGSCCGIVQSVVVDPAVGGDPRAQLVDYEQRVPVLSSEHYELLEVMSKGPDGSYSVTWRKVKGGRAADIVGRASLEPHGTDTLLVYHNLTVMRAFGSGLFAGRYVLRTTRILAAMRARMELLHAHGGAPMQRALSRLRKALGGSRPA